MKEKIILIGGGGHCRSVIDVIEQEGRFTIAGIIEKSANESKTVYNYNVIGTDDELEKLSQQYKYAFITVGHVESNKVRVKLFYKLKALGFNIPTIISPLAYVSKYARVGEGSIIMHHALINVSASVGVNCIINSKALVEHDAIIEKNCHVSTGAIVNGGTILKANSFYGSNTTCKEMSQIEGFIKAGRVVK